MKRKNLLLIIGCLTLLMLWQVNVRAADTLTTTGGTSLDGGGIAFVTDAVYFQPITVTVPDVTPPAITIDLEVVNNESANITFSCNEACNYTFYLSTGDNFTNSSFALSHLQNITGNGTLTNNTLYYYNITACDNVGNCNTSFNNSFITSQNAGLSLPDVCDVYPTPDIECTYIGFMDCGTYLIYNLTGTLLENGTLGTIPTVGGNASYILFNQSEGDYLIEFCDGTESTVKVKYTEEVHMAFGFIILLPIILGGFLLFGGFLLPDEHWHLKIALFILSPISVFAALHFGLLYIINFYPQFTAMQNLIGTTTWWIGGILFALVSYFAIWIIKRIIDYIAKKKADGLNY